MFGGRGGFQLIAHPRRMKNGEIIEVEDGCFGGVAWGERLGLSAQGLVAEVLGMGIPAASPRQQHHCLGRFTRPPPVHPLNLVTTN